MICLLLLVSKLHSQVMEHKSGVDTLTFAERLSLRSNVTDWFLITPNIGVEYDLRRENWNRWAIGLNLKGNWQTNHTFNPGVVYNLSEIKVESRNYWRTRKIGIKRKKLRKTKDGRDTLEVDPYHTSIRPDKEHVGFIDKLFSMRRSEIKHPTTTYYRGLYASYDKYSVKMGSEGKNGVALSAGVTYGIVRPLIVYDNGNSIDFDLGISGGLVYTKYDTYVHNRVNDCYQKNGSKSWHIVPFPVVSEVRVGLVYRFGNYPITRKYRWRYDVDISYQDTIKNLDLTRQSMKRNRDDSKNEKRNERVAKAKVRKAEKRTKVLSDSLQKDSVKQEKLRKKNLKKADKQREKLEKKGKGQDDAERKTEENVTIALLLLKDDRVIMADERRRHYV